MVECAELTSEIIQPNVLFPFVLVLVLDLSANSVLVLQVFVEKDMTVGSVSQGGLHGGGLSAEPERLSGCIWRERKKGGTLQGEGLAEGSMLGMSVVPIFC